MHHYLKDIEAREEGGTPAIIESIRAGLAFQVKQVGTCTNYKSSMFFIIMQTLSVVER